MTGGNRNHLLLHSSCACVSVCACAATWQNKKRCLPMYRDDIGRHWCVRWPLRDRAPVEERTIMQARCSNPVMRSPVRRWRTPRFSLPLAFWHKRRARPCTRSSRQPSRVAVVRRLHSTRRGGRLGPATATGRAPGDKRAGAKHPSRLASWLDLRTRTIGGPRNNVRVKVGGDSLSPSLHPPVPPFSRATSGRYRSCAHASKGELHAGLTKEGENTR